MSGKTRCKKRIAAIVAMFGITAMLFCGCAGGSEENAPGKDAAEIVIGCDNYAPFCYVDSDGNQTGIDVELAKEALGRMGYKANFKCIDWTEKDSLLEQGSIDCIWSSFSMKGRETQYKWAGPYMESHHVIVVNPDSRIQSLKDLKGKTIAYQCGTQTNQVLDDLDEEKNLQIGKIIATSKRDLIYCFLSKGYADAIACYDTAIEQFEEDYNIEYRILDEKLLTVGLGVAFSKSDTSDIAEKLSKTLDEMKKDGTVRQILSRYLDDPDSYLEVEK